MIAEPDHPIMKGFRGFESWDETYVHHKHNEKDRTVLEYRVENERQGAVDVGPHAGQGSRLLHGLGPRRAHLGQSRLPEPVERGIRWAVRRRTRLSCPPSQTSLR